MQRLPLRKECDENVAVKGKTRQEQKQKNIHISMYYTSAAPTSFAPQCFAAVFQKMLPRRNDDVHIGPFFCTYFWVSWTLLF